MTREEFITRIKFELLLSETEFDPKYKWIAVDDTNDDGTKPCYLYTEMPVKSDTKHKEWVYGRSARTEFENFTANLKDHTFFIDLDVDIDWKDSLVSIEELSK